MRKIGYARVSTDAQDYSGQIAALKAAGCDRIVSEKISAATLDRRSLVRLIAELAPRGRPCRHAPRQAR